MLFKGPIGQRDNQENPIEVSQELLLKKSLVVLKSRPTQGCVQGHTHEKLAFLEGKLESGQGV